MRLVNHEQRRFLFAIYVENGKKTGGSTHPSSEGTAHPLGLECAALRVFMKDAQTKDYSVQELNQKIKKGK